MHRYFGGNGVTLLILYLTLNEVLQPKSRLLNVVF